MKLTNADIFNAREPLQKLLEERFPVLTSFKLVKMANTLNEQLKVIDEVRVGLIKRYGTANNKGQIVVDPDSENFPKFVSEFNELMALEVEMVMEKVKLPEDLQIEASVLMALQAFVEV